MTLLLICAIFLTPNFSFAQDSLLPTKVLLPGDAFVASDTSVVYELANYRLLGYALSKGRVALEQNAKYEDLIGVKDKRHATHLAIIAKKDSLYAVKEHQFDLCSEQLDSAKPHPLNNAYVGAGGATLLILLIGLAF